MIRDSLGNKKYWEEQVCRGTETAREKVLALQSGHVDSDQVRQYALSFCFDFLELILRRYSRGDEVRDLTIVFKKLLHSSDFSSQLKNVAGTGFEAVLFDLENLDHYVLCLQLLSLALIFDVKDDAWKKLVALMAAEGEDALLDRIIAVRSPRRLGHELLHPRPYKRLLDAINSEDKQAELLAEFVGHWFAELKRSNGNGLYWYDYGGSGYRLASDDCYFGRWCLESLAVSIAFRIDDELCIGRPHYPADLATGHAWRKRPKLPKNSFLRSRPRVIR